MSAAERRGRLAVARLCEVEEQHEGVAVGRDGARAQRALLRQVFGEECLDQRGEAEVAAALGYSSASSAIGKALERAPATAISWGTPVRGTSRCWTPWRGPCRWTGPASR